MKIALQTILFFLAITWNLAARAQTGTLIQAPTTSPMAAPPTPSEATTTAPVVAPATQSETAAPNPPAAATESLASEADSFGGNEALYEKAKALNPEIQTDIVQNRFVNLAGRFEIAPEYSGVFGADAYNQTQNLGLNLHYHITPTWAIGVKYNHSYNKLTAEGDAAIDRARQDVIRNPENPTFLFPQVIYPKSERLGQITWSPIVGKLSFGNWGVAHFDTYFLAGAGTIELSNGSSSLWAVGAGMGFWLNQNAALRLEYRTENYRAEYFESSRTLQPSIASMQVGWLL